MSGGSSLSLTRRRKGREERKGGSIAPRDKHVASLCDLRKKKLLDGHKLAGEKMARTEGLEPPTLSSED